MKACGFTFFIYLFHEPTLNIIRKILIIPFHHSSFGFAFSYLASPWIFAVIWIIIGIGFKRIMPHIYRFAQVDDKIFYKKHNENTTLHPQY